MKHFKIPLIEKTFDIYIGKDEWEKYKRDTIKEGAREDVNTPLPLKGSGKAWGGWIWVSDLKDRQLVIHELSHLIDDTMNDLKSHDTEFRAYITMWIIDNVLKWIEKC